MNLRKTAIALAVAGTTVAAPMAAQAGADEVYASARVGIMNTDTGDVSETDVRSFSSRFGAKGETDLGNGLTGYGRYEWDVDFNEDNGEDDIGVRQRWVGLKGDFGSVQIGRGWWTAYSFVVGPTDNPWWHSGYAMIEYRGRTDNAITYTGGTGDVKFGVSAYFGNDFVDEQPGTAAVPADLTTTPITLGSAAVPASEEQGEETLDQLEVGVSFGIGDMTLGLALHTSEYTPIGNGIVDSSGDPEEVIGANLSGIGLGPATLGVGFQVQDDDTGVFVQLDVGNAYVRLETESLDGDAIAVVDRGGEDRDRVGLTLGYTQSLGRKTTMYYEFWTMDEDTDDSDDDNQHIMAVLKYDII
jgi:predicted porin